MLITVLFIDYDVFISFLAWRSRHASRSQPIQNTTLHTSVSITSVFINTPVVFFHGGFTVTGVTSV